MIERQFMNFEVKLHVVWNGGGGVCQAYHLNPINLFLVYHNAQFFLTINRHSHKLLYSIQYADRTKLANKKV